jgi:hypothetical protein
LRSYLGVCLDWETVHVIDIVFFLVDVGLFQVQIHIIEDTLGAHFEGFVWFF